MCQNDSADYFAYSLKVFSDSIGDTGGGRDGPWDEEVGKYLNTKFENVKMKVLICIPLHQNVHHGIQNTTRSLVGSKKHFDEFERRDMFEATVVSVITHTSRWTAQGMGY